MNKKRRLWMLLGAAVLLTPLGLLTDASAWGEWEESYYQKALGYIPHGIKNAPHWHAPLPDYALHGLSSVAGYYLSALVGVAAIYGVFWLMSRSRKRDA